MLNLKSWFQPSRMIVHTDGAIRPSRNLSGLAAIVRSPSGEICHWWSTLAGPMTCNEAEYAAVIFALQKLRLIQTAEIEVYSDSRLVVDQMLGLARAKAPGLQPAYRALKALVVEFNQVRFHHIPREKNRLADALANDTVDGYYQAAKSADQKGSRNGN